MKNKKVKSLFIILVAIMIVAFNPISTGAGSIDEAKEQKFSLEQKKKEIDEQIASLEREKDDIVNYIEKLDAQMNQLTKEMDLLSLDIKDAEADLEVAEEELNKAKALEDEQYGLMSKRIQYIYENGEPSFIQILLESKDISEFLNQVEIRSKISEYDNNILEEYVKAKELVAEKEEVLANKLDSLNLMYEELSYEQDAVEKLAKDKGDELLKREDELIEAESSADEYKEQIEAKQTEINRLLAEQGYGTGSLAWPTPASRRITSGFNPNRLHPVYNYVRPHNGIDIGAPNGSRIIAADSGRVVGRGYSSSAGNYINIDHGNGVVTKYFHCSSLVASAGAIVEKGQLIAHVGSTGASTGPHLHFEVVKNGTAVNPRNFVN